MNGNRFELDDADLDQVSGGVVRNTGKTPLTPYDSYTEANAVQAAFLAQGVCPNYVNRVVTLSHGDKLTGESVNGFSGYKMYYCSVCGVGWKVKNS